VKRHFGEGRETGAKCRGAGIPVSKMVFAKGVTGSGGSIKETGDKGEEDKTVGVRKWNLNCIPTARMLTERAMGEGTTNPKGMGAWREPTLADPLGDRIERKGNRGKRSQGVNTKKLRGINGRKVGRGAPRGRPLVQVRVTGQSWYWHAQPPRLAIGGHDSRDRTGTLFREVSESI